MTGRTAVSLRRSSSVDGDWTEVNFYCLGARFLGLPNSIFLSTKVCNEVIWD